MLTSSAGARVGLVPLLAFQSGRNFVISGLGVVGGGVGKDSPLTSGLFLTLKVLAPLDMPLCDGRERAAWLSASKGACLPEVPGPPGLTGGGMASGHVQVAC